MTVPYTSSFDQTIAFSDTCAQFALATGVAQSYTVPGASHQKYTALMTYASNSNVFVGYNVVAASPTSGTNTTVVREEFKPRKRYVIGGDVLSFITPDTSAYVGLSLRAISNS